MNFINADFGFLLSASVCATVGAIFDLRTRRIPNLLNVLGIVLGLMTHLLLGGWHAMLTAAAAGLLCGAGFFLFFVVGGMGAGDVKLITAVGCLAGSGSISEVVLATVISGGLFAVALAVVRGRLKSTVSNVGALFFHHGKFGLLEHPELNLLNSATLRLPYGVAIAAGCWATLFGQHWMS